MYVTNVATTFNFTLPPTSTVFTASDWDISIEDPNGLYVYSDEGIIDAVPPTTTTAGTMSFTTTPLIAGVHTLTLSKGTATSHQIMHKQVIVVVEPTTATPITITY